MGAADVERHELTVEPACGARHTGSSSLACAGCGRARAGLGRVDTAEGKWYHLRAIMIMIGTLG
jgi:hypothetical protein